MVPEGYRGVLNKYFTPGKYYLNPFAYSHTLVQSTNVTVDWDNQDETKFDPLKVISKDGFDIKLSVKVIVRVLPEQAPYMVSKSGTMDNLIHSVINPNIDASFRNQASSADAIDFLSNREIEQKKAEDDIRRILSKYHVECVSVLIVQIELPQSLLDTKTQKVIADNQMAQYDAQTKAEEARTNLEKQTAFANQQQDLVTSELSIKIAQNEKQRKITDAEASAEVLNQQGIGEQKKLEAIGNGEAAKISAIGKATAEAYTSQKAAVGQDQLFAIEIVKQFSKVLQDNPSLKLIPDVYVGGNGSALDGLFGQLAKAFPNINISGFTPS
ncbi:SPFH domain-containing protein [Flavobacterium croceum]|uniref:SPFH domain-containing protein n=1 Tax=Flavobacterium croceum TaxID=370975 RepID=UPI0024A9AF3D|nr:SPFH domain-containing protein [Flavobacterium croceum]